MNALVPWANYFIAEASAAGALTGLIFVALSFNFEQIIAGQAWLDRAATGLITLAQPIFYALVSLWAARTAQGPGWTTAALAVIATVAMTRIVLRRPGSTLAGPRSQASRLVITLIEPAATIIGSVLVATGNRAGAFVQACGGLAGLAIGLATAWILLVEVRRTRP
jgi:hypothetical protein